MDSREWMAVNPCDDCASSPRKDPQAFDGCEVFNTCVQYGVRIGGIAAQKKLLEYQINTVEHDLNFSPLMELFKNWLTLMIKQLEEKNG